MSRKVDFRDDGNAFGCCIGYYIADLVLSVITAVWLSVKLFPVLQDNCSLAYGTFLCKLRIFLDLDSPALIVCKMPVEGVQLVYLHDVEISLDNVNTEEVA